MLFLVLLVSKYNQLLWFFCINLTLSTIFSCFSGDIYIYISFGLSINFSASNPTLCLGATEVFDLQFYFLLNH